MIDSKTNLDIFWNNLNWWTIFNNARYQNVSKSRGRGGKSIMDECTTMENSKTNQQESNWLVFSITPAALPHLAALRLERKDWSPSTCRDPTHDHKHAHIPFLLHRIHCDIYKSSTKLWARSGAGSDFIRQISREQLSRKLTSGSLFRILNFNCSLASLLSKSVMR